MAFASNQSLLLVLPVPFLRKSDGLFLDAQACNGLNLWANNFDRVTVACPTLPPNSLDHEKSIQWCNVDSIPCRNRIHFEELPWAHTPFHFLRRLPRTSHRLTQMIAQNRFLCFAIGGLFGDWAAVACVQAHRRGREFSVWTDRVETQVIRQSLHRKSYLKRMYWRFLIPIMSCYHRWLIRKSSLGLFHGRDCYNSYSIYSKHPHCVHDIHLTTADQISQAELQTKCQEIAQKNTTKNLLCRSHGGDEGTARLDRSCCRTAAERP